METYFYLLKKQFYDFLLIALMSSAIYFLAIFFGFREPFQYPVSLPFLFGGAAKILENGEGGTLTTCHFYQILLCIGSITTALLLTIRLYFL